MSGDVWAVMPVKDLRRAKTRLAANYSPRVRARLAYAMAHDVLVALAAAPLAGIVVVTVDPRVEALARRCGARVLAEGADEGHTRAVAAAASLLALERRGGMLTVAGDLPCVTPKEIACVLAAHGGSPSFTIVPARDGRGSNAIAVSPPDAVPLAFGNESFGLHVAAARRCGIAPTVVSLPGIGLDIDTPEDIAALRAQRACGHASRFLELIHARQPARLAANRSGHRGHDALKDQAV